MRQRSPTSLKRPSKVKPCWLVPPFDADQGLTDAHSKAVGAIFELICELDHTRFACLVAKYLYDGHSCGEGHRGKRDQARVSKQSGRVGRMAQGERRPRFDHCWRNLGDGISRSVFGTTRYSDRILKCQRLKMNSLDATLRTQLERFVD